jgi:hypothetical protein
MARFVRERERALAPVSDAFGPDERRAG